MESQPAGDAVLTSVDQPESRERQAGVWHSDSADRKMEIMSRRLYFSCFLFICWLPSQIPGMMKTLLLGMTFPLVTQNSFSTPCCGGFLNFCSLEGRKRPWIHDLSLLENSRRKQELVGAGKDERAAPGRDGQCFAGSSVVRAPPFCNA